MMTVAEIMAELKSRGEDNIKKILLKHGVKEPLFGVKVQYLKLIEKKIKKDYQLARDLYATGNADAMYLAGLIADDEKMTKKDLQTWIRDARSQNIFEYTVPWVATGSRFGFELATEWIDAKDDSVAAAGWQTLSGWVSLKADADLDIPALKALLHRVEKKISSAGNRECHAMNNFIIATGSYVTALSPEAMSVAKKIGVVTVDVGDTSCKVPDATTYILKAKDKGTLGKKKKTVKC